MFGPSHFLDIAKERPALRDRITRGKPRVQNCVSRGRCRLGKTEKIFSAHNKQEKSGFQKNYEIFFDRKLSVRAFSRYVPIRAEPPLPSSCC